MNWHVIYTKRSQEKRAMVNLERQGFACYLPTLALQKVVRGSVVTTREPLFPRYLFVRLESEQGSWTTVRSTRGVTRLVTFGTEVAEVPPALIDRLRAEEGAAGVVPLFKQGEPVRVTTGSFAGIEGIFLTHDGETRALVLIELLQSFASLPVEIGTLRPSTN